MPRRNLVYGAILVILFLSLYWRVFAGLYRVWTADGDNSYCILIPFVSLYLIWTRRKELHWHEAKPSYMGLGISIVSLLAYVVSYAGGIQLVPRLTVVSSLIALFLFNFGGSVFSVLSFPFFFLFFVVPVPVSIVKLASFSLQLLVTNVSARIIETLSIPVLRESNILHLADTSLEVAEACSGIRSLTSFFVIGVLFAYLMNASITRRPIMVLTAIPTPFLPNLLRVAGSRVLAFEFGGRLARGFLHSFSGMAILAVGFLVMGISFHLLEQTWNHTQV